MICDVVLDHPHRLPAGACSLAFHAHHSISSSLIIHRALHACAPMLRVWDCRELPSRRHLPAGSAHQERLAAADALKLLRPDMCCACATGRAAAPHQGQPDRREANRGSAAAGGGARAPGVPSRRARQLRPPAGAVRSRAEGVGTPLCATSPACADALMQEAPASRLPVPGRAVTLSSGIIEMAKQVLAPAMEERTHVRPCSDGNC